MEIFPAYARDHAIRVEFFGDEVDRISEINVVTGVPSRMLAHVAIYPASHYVTTREKMERAIEEIRREMEERVRYFEESEKAVEAQRIRQRTMYDIEMMRELGYCTGIENYSRVISGRPAGFATHDAAGLFSKRFSAVCGRVPCDHSSGASHVLRGQGSKGKSCGIWVSAALCLR